MCRDCGCEEASRDHELWLKGRPLRPAHPENIPMLPRRILLEQAVLAKNGQLAAENRRWFNTNKVRVLNIMSSPGSGKTLLLEKTVQQLAGKMTRKMKVASASAIIMEIITLQNRVLGIFQCQ